MTDYFAKYGDLYIKQLETEARYKALGEENAREAFELAKTKGEASRTNLGQQITGHKFKHLCESVGTFVDAALKPKRGTKAEYVGLLAEMAEVYGKERTEHFYSVLTFATFSNMLNLCFRKEYHISNMAQAIARELQDEYNLECYLKNASKQKIMSVNLGIDKRVQELYRRAYATARMDHDDYTYKRWSKDASVALGATLVEIVVESGDLFEYVSNKGQNVGTTKEIRPTQALLDGWEKNENSIISRSFRLCPTVIPPRPWIAYNDGGYYGELSRTSTLLRIRDQRSVFGKGYLAKLNQLELANVRKAINAIQDTPWRINTQVLQVVKQICNQGGGKAGIPHITQAPPPCVLPANHTEEQLQDYKDKMKPYYRSETRRRSLALRALSHVRIAEEFASHERIYFPHNMDFRGRVYPIPAFSPQGDDLNKALLLFADAPPCETMDDIGWLMIHGANLAGIDKVSFEDRKQWVIDNEQNILASAADPLGHLWWANQDDQSCQLLAWCFEWSRWKGYEAKHGTPKGFVSGIPIAFDGTCSGLQHFSAILRDPIGGKAVNLIPSDKPQDIYRVVADKVNKQLKIDAKEGTLDAPAQTKDGKEYTKFGTRLLAQQWLTYGVTRKVTKRSVMTLAYGSKEFGFRDQILVDTIKPDITAKEERGKISIFVDTHYQAAGYLAKLIWQAVSTTVVKAVEGMKWLQTCASAVTKERQVVSWTTPMGLIVQQSYMECESRVVRLRCAGKLLRLYIAELTGNIDKRAQASGIAPNFIHSMDAAHLQLTVCNCSDAGIRHFAMIHDSYGAPVAQAGRIFEIVRESFMQMYSQHDVLASFRSELQNIAPVELPEPPSRGDLDIQCVTSSLYVFS